MPTDYQRPIKDGHLQSDFDAEGRKIHNADQIGVGSNGTPATALHLAPGTAPTTADKGIRFGSDVDVYRDGARSLNIDADVLKVNGTEVPAGAHSYTHDQVAPSASWSINHGLGRRPSVTVQDSAGTTVEGDVDYVDANNLTITFSSGFSGKAYLN